jgi:hypothetical protein
MNQSLNLEPCLPSEIFTPLNLFYFFVLLGHGSEGQCPFHQGTLITNNLSLFETGNTKLAYGFNEIIDDFFKRAPFILTA